MKKLKTACLSFLFLIGFMSCNSPADVSKSKSITKDDFLKADGKVLKTKSGKGNPVILRGVNAGGYLLQEFWMTAAEYTKNITAEFDIYNNLSTRFGEDKMLELIEIYQDSYWSEEDFDNCANMGMNCIRLPFWYRNLVDRKGEFKKDAFKRMDWFVKEAGKRGLYVIIDFHGAPGSQNGSDHSGVDGRDQKEKASKFFFGDEVEENQALYYKIIEELAKHYKGNPVVAGYDLLNEPYCTYRYNSKLSADKLHQLLWTVYDNAYNKIRAIDPDHVIIMEATWDPVDLPDPKKYGWENVMYEYHNYYYGDDNNTTGRQITNMKTKLFAITQVNYNVPSYLGEFNYFANLKAWDDGLKLLNDYGINWTIWTYKTIRSVGNWGLYYNSSRLRPINLETASYDQIKESFSSMQTADCNTSLRNLVAKYLSAEPVLVDESKTEEVTSLYSGWAHYEGENAKLHGGALESQPFYSNEAAVGNLNTGVALSDVSDDLENVNYVEFSIEAPEDGQYGVVLTYNGDDDKTIMIKTNDEKPFPLEVKRQGKGEWDKAWEKFFFVKLNKGTNTLKISGTVINIQTWLNIDCIDVSKYPLCKNGNTIRYEAEAFDTNAGLEYQDFFSGEYCVGQLNTSLKAKDVTEDWENMKYVTFTIYAEEAGSYNILWAYNGDGSNNMKAMYKVNDSKSQVLTLNNKGKSWDKMNSVKFNVDLNKGFNTLLLSGTIELQSHWANIDYIDVSRN